MENSKMRAELVDYLKGLSSRAYQYNCWVHKSCPEGVEHDELDYAVHFLFDDTNLSCKPESYIGTILKDSKEAGLVKDVCVELTKIFDTHGYDHPDEKYIELREWASVLDAASKAIKVMKQCFKGVTNPEGLKPLPPAIIEDENKREIERCWRLGNDKYLLQQSEDELPLLSNLNLSSYDVFSSIQGESLSEEIMKVANIASNTADQMYLERIAQMANLISTKEGWTITFTPFSRQVYVPNSVSPDGIKFSQPTISQNFSSNGSISDLVAGLRNGTVKPSDVPAIRVVKRNGELITLVNRRLAAFQAAGVDVPIQRVSLSNPNIAAEFAKKFNPVNGELNIVVTLNAAGRNAAESTLRSQGKIR